VWSRSLFLTLKATTPFKARCFVGGGKRRRRSHLFISAQNFGKRGAL